LPRTLSGFFISYFVLGHFLAKKPISLFDEWFRSRGAQIAFA